MTTWAEIEQLRVENDKKIAELIEHCNRLITSINATTENVKAATRLILSAKGYQND